MGRERAAAATASIEREVRALLAEIDALAQSQEGRWAEKRGNYRRQFQADCGIRYLAADRESVIATSGATRDISPGGLGFLSPEHFLRRTELLVLVQTSAGNVKRLTGKVVYSRRAGEGWYLTGMRFGPLEGVDLAKDVSAATPSTRPPATGAVSRPPRGAPDKTSGPPITKRQRALSVLAAVGAARTHTKESVARVVTLSMSPHHEVRRAAIPVLLQIGGQDGIVSLIGMLDDPNPVNQSEAAMALGQLRATQAVGPLRKLLHHKNRDVLLSAAEALARMEDQSGLSPVLHILRSDISQSRRAARVFGVLIGQDFRPNADGVAAARRYADVNRL